MGERRRGVGFAPERHASELRRRACVSAQEKRVGRFGVGCDKVLGGREVTEVRPVREGSEVREVRKGSEGEGRGGSDGSEGSKGLKGLVAESHTSQPQVSNHLLQIVWDPGFNEPSARRQ
jgi:hypothetical protein